MLLLTKPVKEFVRLGHDLRYEGVLIVILNVVDLSAHLVVLLRGLVHVAH